MKKLLKLLICLLLISLSAFMITACSDKDDKTADNVKLLTDFEDVKSLMSIKLTAPESQIFLNSDKNFVTSGEKSMMLHLNQALGASGYYSDSILQFIPGQEYFAHTDFKDVTAISFDIWNDNEFDIDTCLSINNRRVVLEYTVLKPGYNKVEFNIDRNQAFSISETFLLSVDLSFYSGKGNEVIYIDNVCIATTDEEYKPFDYDAIFTDDLISYGFEYYAETLSMIDLGGFDSIFSRARMTVNTDKQYVKNSEGSLKVEFKASPIDNKVDNTVIRTSDNYFADFEKFTDGNYSLCADVFNASDKTVTVELKVFSTIDDETCSLMVDVPAKSWVDSKTFNMPIARIKNAFTNTRISVLTVVIGFYGVEANDVMYIDNLGFVKNQSSESFSTDIKKAVGEKVTLDKTLFTGLDENKTYSYSFTVKETKGLTTKTVAFANQVQVEKDTYYEVFGTARSGTETIKTYKIIYPNEMQIFTFNNLGNGVYTSDNSNFGMLDSTVKTEMVSDQTGNGKIAFSTLRSVDYEVWGWTSMLKVGKKGGKMYFDLSFKADCEEWLIELVKNETILFNKDAGRYSIDIPDEEIGKNIVYKFGVNGNMLKSNAICFDNVVFVPN